MSGYTEETWLETFKPIKNHLSNEAGWNGVLFDTYGDEIDFVINQPEENIWTYLDDEYGNCIIVAGYWLEGRIGYFITEVARDPKDKEMWDDLCIMVFESSKDGNANDYTTMARIAEFLKDKDYGED